jgi:hypothetical protein
MALVDDDVVLLDARNDRYACLSACDAEAIRMGYAARRWEDGVLARELIAAGYLVPASGMPTIVEAAPSLPKRDLHTLVGDIPRLSASDLIGATVSGLATAWRLRTQRPRHWLRARADGTDAQDRCIALARRFAEAHLYLPGLARCLPRSLALIDFLQRHGATAQLIFGVRTHPFEAHCWVQSGDVILNDTVSRASWYTPIAWS